MSGELRFIDLFAGLGGFHHGLSKSGGFKCVFASEINPKLRGLYEVNHGLKAVGDIRQVAAEEVPVHDVLCAGFPCQPFSLAGSKQGSGCPKSGRLIEQVVRIAGHRRPEFLILENVPGLLTVASGSIWKYMNSAFGEIGYRITHKIISPLQVGVPQDRKRLFVLASLNHDLNGAFDWPVPDRPSALREFFLGDPISHREVEPRKQAQLEKWQQFLTGCALPEEMPIETISAPEFGASYPLDFSKIDIGDLRGCLGAYGQPLGDCSNWNEVLDRLPSYCRKNRRVPPWLIRSVEFSREIYKRNRSGWMTGTPISTSATTAGSCSNGGVPEEAPAKRAPAAIPGVWNPRLKSA